MDPLNVVATTGHGTVWLRKIFQRRRPMLMGFFRIAPFHAFPHGQTVAVLDMVARHPNWFGFPNEPRTCVVNTAHFSEVAHRHQSGLFVLGLDRGCKTLIIPGSTDCAHEFSPRNAKQVEVILRRNPGIESLYLSRECQGMFRELVPQIQALAHLENLTMEGWDDPVAIHKVLMAAKRVQRPDFFSLDGDGKATQSLLTTSLSPNRESWRTPVGVQALCTLIEMHPRLKGIYGTRGFVTDWYAATQTSRCLHNVSLIPFGCNYVLFWYGIWAFCVLSACWFVAKWTHDYILVRLVNSEHARMTVWFVVLFLSSGGVLMADAIFAPRRGWMWTRMVKNVLLGIQRLERKSKVTHQESTARIALQ